MKQAVSPAKGAKTSKGANHPLPTCQPVQAVLGTALKNEAPPNDCCCRKLDKQRTRSHLQMTCAWFTCIEPKENRRARALGVVAITGEQGVDGRVHAAIVLRQGSETGSLRKGYPSDVHGTPHFTSFKECRQKGGKMGMERMSLQGPSIEKTSPHPQLELRFAQAVSCSPFPRLTTPRW